MRTVLIIIVIILLLLTTYLGYEKGFQMARRELPERDTIEIVIYKRDTINLTASAEIKYKKQLVKVFIKDTIEKIDTVIQVYPFTARLDTIINDTIQLKYFYPSNIFDLQVRARLDSIIKTENINVYQTKEVQILDNAYWWGLGSGVLFMLILIGAISG